MRFFRAVAVLVFAACASTPNPLSGPLAFPVNAQFATVTPAQPGQFPKPVVAVVYLVDEPYEVNSCRDYVTSCLTGDPVDLDFVSVGVSTWDGGPVGPGTYAIESPFGPDVPADAGTGSAAPSDAGPGYASVSYVILGDAGPGSPVGGIGGTVTLTQVGSTWTGSFSTTVGGVTLSGTFSAGVCPVAPLCD